MPAALRLLVRLQILGFVRSRGRASILIALGVVAVLFCVPVDPPRPAGGAGDLQPAVRAFMMLALLGLTIATVTLARGRNVSFTPAEIDGLFPGPFDGRQLVLYKVAFIAIGAAWPAMLVAIVYRRVAGAGLAGPIGMWLAFVNAHLLAMLAQATWRGLRQRPTSWAALAGTVAAVVLPLAALAELAVFVAGGQRTATAFLACVARSWALGLVLLPFDLVARVYTARGVPDLLFWAVPSLALTAVTVWTLLRLHAPLIERAVESRELFSRLTRRSLRGERSASRAAHALTGVRLGMLPWLGGAGPTAWVRLLAALRAPGRLVAVAALTLLLAFVASLARPTGGRGAALAIATLWLVLLPATVPFDFRLEAGDLAVWKALPVGRLALTLGQLATPYAVLTLLGWVGLGAIALWAPALGGAMTWAALFVPATSLLAVAIENALFLAFPATNVPTGDVDPVAALHGWLLVLGRLIAWSLVGSVAVSSAAFVGRLLGSEAAGVAAAWLVVVTVAAAAVTGVAWLAGRLDPSTALPPA